MASLYKKKRVDLGKKGSFNVREGALHRALGVPEGEKIGEARIERAENSRDPKARRMARSAEGLAHMKR